MHPTTRFAHALSRCTLLAVVASASLLGTAAHAADGNVPAFQTTGNVRYSCGGIGSDESTAMRSEMKNYPLSLLFARKDGEYLANMAVEIQGKNGSPIQFKASGPICLINLPAGSYTVKAATHGGTYQTKSVEVGRNSQSLDFRY